MPGELMAVTRIHSRGRAAGAAALAGALVALLAGGQARAAVITPTTTADGLADDDTCTLREAVIAANVNDGVLGCAAGNGDDVIALGHGTYRLTTPPTPPAKPFDMFTGDLVVDAGQQELTIAAVGGEGTIDASAIDDRAITARSPLRLINVTVTGGDATNAAEGAGLGGGVATLDGNPSLTVVRSLITGNSTSQFGGGLHASGSLELNASTVSGNTTDASGGGGAGVDVEGPATVVRSTIAANSASSGDNSAVGGGLRYGGDLTLFGSILADNSADGGDPECTTTGAGAGSGGFNVVEALSAGCSLALIGSDVEADPGLHPLADNGGPTRTQRIDPGSPAAEVGPAGGGCRGQIDQRGVPRAAPGTGSCDAGAYEIAFCAFTPANVVGTAVDDVLTSGKNPISMLGLGGSDALLGGPGDDSLCGGDGVDLLDGGPGADVLVGGGGVDIASYRSATTQVSVTLDNKANDGTAGEGDLVQTESVIGGSAADEIIGNDQSNGVHGREGGDSIRGEGGADSLLGQGGGDSIAGGEGDDLIRGGDAKDVLRGEAGADHLEGDAGSDVLDGGAGRDRLDGGGGGDKLKGRNGRDILDGGGGRDKLVGGSGNDRLAGGPGRDVIKCGAGRDRVVADRKDKVARDCERVKRRR